MSYRGAVAKLPVGQTGFNGTQNPSQALPSDFVYVDGAELEGGIIRKEGGAEKFNTAFLGGVQDPQTIILLHMNGTDASTTFTDSAVVPHTFTAAGNAQIDTAQSKFGGASGLFDGTGDVITTPDSADFTLGSGDFTVDFQFNCNAAGGTVQRIAGQGDSSETITLVSFAIRRTAGNFIQAYVAQGGSIVSVTSTTQFTNAVNTGWHHCAFVRTGSILKLFIDGVQEGGNIAIAGAVNNSARLLAVGSQGEISSELWTGWIDEFRLSVGVARWTGNFTPPTAAYTNLIAPGSVVISGLHWSATPTINYDVVFLDNGSVLRDDGTGTFAVNMKTGLISIRAPPPYFMVAGGENVGEPRKLMLFSSTNQVQFADGTGLTLANISAPAADWSASFPTFGVFHSNRVFAGGNASDPHRLYYSTTANHEEFVAAGSGTLPIYPGEGERLAGAISFRGALIVFKYPQGIYVVNTTDPTPANWTVAPLTRAVGALNQHAIVQVENDILYMDRTGNINSLAATNEFGDVNTANIGDTKKIATFMRANVNLGALQRVQGVWYPSKRQVWWCMPLIGTTDNNFRFIAAMPDPAIQDQVGPRFFMSRRDSCISIWAKPDTDGIRKPTIGDNSGFVWVLDQEERNKDGVAYPITFETSNTDLSFIDPSLATRSKAGQFLELAFEPRGNWDLTVETFWDDVLTGTILFDMGFGGAALGSFILDTDVLASNAVRSTRRRLVGSGRRLKLICQNAGLNQDVSISEFHVSFMLMDERAD